MKYHLKDSYHAIFESAVAATIRYLSKYKNLDSVVIGVSGGIDSALTSIIACEACDRLLMHRHVKVIGRSIPIISNKADELGRARKIGQIFCSEFEELDLSDAWESTAEALAPEDYKAWKSREEQGFDTPEEIKIRLGNIKARLRMISLYQIASANRGMVMSTDNFTEFLLGFWTLHGDVGDFGALQSLFKTEVYGLADWLIATWETTSSPNPEQEVLSDCIEAVATDGLGITESDSAQLLPSYPSYNSRHAYEVIDRVLIEFLNGKAVDEFKTEHRVIIHRHLASEFKRQRPFNVLRNELVY